MSAQTINESDGQSGGNAFEIELTLLLEAIYTATDPPVKALRRVIPPLKLGGVALDLSILVLFLILAIAMRLVVLI